MNVSQYYREARNRMMTVHNFLGEYDIMNWKFLRRSVEVKSEDDNVLMSTYIRYNIPVYSK